jgi:fatty acid desaturase
MASESFDKDREVRETEAEREKSWERDWEQEEEERTPGYWWVRLAWVVVLTVALYLLGRGMVRHHFFSGGAMDYHNHPTGP